MNNRRGGLDYHSITYCPRRIIRRPLIICWSANAVSAFAIDTPVHRGGTQDLASRRRTIGSKVEIGSLW